MPGTTAPDDLIGYEIRCFLNADSLHPIILKACQNRLDQGYVYELIAAAPAQQHAYQLRVHLGPLIAAQAKIFVHGNDKTTLRVHLESSSIRDEAQLPDSVQELSQRLIRLIRDQDGAAVIADLKA